MKKSGLGRGLGAFFDETNEVVGESVIEIPIDEIDPDLSQPRKRFAQEPLEQLAASIRSVGVLQPILVYAKEGRYTIIAGERRWRSSRLAGMSTIPAIVRDIDHVRRMEIALIENLQREDLNPLEEAAGIHRLMEDCGLTQQAVADRLGKSRSAVANTLRLLDMPPVIQELLREGRISAGHARAAAMSEGVQAQEKIAYMAAEGNWSVRQTEDAARKGVKTGVADIETSLSVQVAPEVREFLERFSQLFGTKVYMKSTRDGYGQVVLPYQGMADLERFDDVLQLIIHAMNEKQCASSDAHCLT